MSFPTYAHYKDSGVEWLGEVPAHWDVKSIRRVAELNPSKSEAAHLDRETEVSFLPMEAVGDDGKLNLDRTRPIGEVENGYTFFKEGDVTIAKITPCFENGKGAVMTGLQNGFGFGTTELIVTRPKLGHVTNHFLHWLYLSTTFRKTAEAAMYGAGGQKRVPDDFVRDFVTAFPPISEQDTISAFLARETTKLDALITEQRTLIDLLKEKRQADISHAVTKGLDPQVPMKDSGVEWLGEVPAHWDVTKAGRYLSILPGYAFPSTEFSLDEANTKLLRGINVGVSKIKWDETVYWRRFDGDGLDAFELADGDIVIGMDRPYISEGMRVARISEADLPCLLLQRVAAIRASGKLSDDHILLLLSSNMFLDHFSPETTGVSVPHISPSQIAEFIIPIPPLEEQKDIFKWVEVEITRIDALTAEAQTTIALLQERRSALISAAVTGKIDVRQAA